MKNNKLKEIIYEIEEHRKERATQIIKESHQENIRLKSLNVPYLQRKHLREKIRYCQSVIDSKEIIFKDFEIWDSFVYEIKKVGFKTFVWIYKDIFYENKPTTIK
jgi:hypothetical protein